MTMMKDSWYCAGWSSDVTDTPLHRKILGQDIVLFRDSKGALQAISDKCPHRFAPLHKGQIKGDTIECPYHGLRFDGTGTCALNPHGSGQVPPGQHTQAFPIEERDATIWIWMGDPAKADPSQIMDTSFLTDTENFASFTEHHPIKGNYMLVVDNLLDLTHAQFLHPETVFGKAAAERWAVSMSGKSSGEEALQEVWFEETETSLTAHQMMRSKPQPPLWDPIVDYGISDLHSWITWYAPSNMDLRLDLTPAGSNQAPARMIVVHLITPIDELNCHYFVGLGFDTNIEDKQAVEGVRQIVLQTLADEDGPMIEMCQSYMDGETDLFALKPILLQTDGVAIKARRRMQKLLQAQA